MKKLLILTFILTLTCILASCALYDDKTPTEGLLYTLNKDESSYSVAGLGSAKSKNIVIPDTYNGLPVTAISDCAFQHKGRKVRNVTIPEGVTTIGEYAFNECSTSNFTIPKSVTYIGDSAFSNSGVGNLYISDIESWCNIEFGNSSANPLHNRADLYLNGNLVTELVIPDTVKEIKNYSFSGCTSLTSITIPNSVEFIGDYAFSDCTSLTSVTITNSVTSIGNGVFSSCTNLQYNEYDNAYYLGNENNPFLVLVKAKSTDITSCTVHDNSKFIHSNAFQACTSLTGITIPNSVTSIGGAAFYECRSLKSITIPNSVTSIDYSAFYDCTSLTSVTIGNNITSIGKWAFSGCSSLTSVTFENPDGWWYAWDSTAASGTNISTTDLSDTSTAATYLTNMYHNYYWKRS